MSSDDDARRQRPAIANYAGQGVNITMLCGKCKKPRQQLGSKRVRMRGVLVAVCKQCVEEMPK